MQEVERPHTQSVLTSAKVEGTKVGNAAVIADSELAIDDDRLDGGVAIAPVIEGKRLV